MDNKTDILFTRIDDRFLHGQVGIAWNQQIKASTFLAANDDLAVDIVQQRIMNSSTPAGTTFICLSILDAAKALIHEKFHRVFLLVGSAEDVVRLMKQGVVFNKINVGNLQNRDGCIRVTGSVYVNNNDRNAFKTIRDSGVKIEIQRVPTSPIEDSTHLFK
jgi:PTS system N-acetylgalactosamine-specific IIB component